MFFVECEVDVEECLFCVVIKIELFDGDECFGGGEMCRVFGYVDGVLGGCGGGGSWFYGRCRKFGCGVYYL